MTENEDPDTQNLEISQVQSDLQNSDDEEQELNKSQIRNQQKKARQSGLEYTDPKGNIHQGRRVKTACSDTCHLHCSSRISLQERLKIHENFWTLDDAEKIRFYDQNLLKKPIERRTKENAQKQRNFTIVYHFHINGTQEQVCRTMFVNTLGISIGRINYYMASKQGDENPSSYRHGTNKSRFTSEEQKEQVREQIRSIPTVDSHYCRESSTKKYFDCFLSLTSLFDNYAEMNKDNHVSFSTYRKIFLEEFKISFHKPRKDQCDRCHLLDHQGSSLSVDERSSIEQHKQQKDFTRQEKKTDKENVMTNRNKKRLTVVYDLENVLSVPKGPQGSWFYLSKLNCYHQTATVLETKKVYTAFWDESLAGRSGNDMASAWTEILSAILIDHPDTEEIVVWSDSCVPQNKNRMMSMAALMLLKNHPNLKKLEHKYGEAGHSFCQEVDSVHSVIERKLKPKEIGSPVSLLQHLKAVKINSKSLIIKEMKKEDFKNFESKASAFNFQLIPYAKVKSLLFQKSSLMSVGFKLSFAPSSSFFYQPIVKFSRNKRGAAELPENVPSESKKQKLSETKVNCIRKMLKDLNEEDREFFKTHCMIKTNSSNDEM